MKQTPVDSGGEAESLTPPPDSLASGVEGKGEGDACGGNADHEGANQAARTGDAPCVAELESALRNIVELHGVLHSHDVWGYGDLVSQIEATLQNAITFATAKGRDTLGISHEETGKSL